MATSGSFNTTGYEGRYLVFSWSVKNTQADRISTNKSVISWSLKGAGTGGAGYYYAGNFKLVIDGQTVYSSADRIKLYNGTTVASGTITLTHDSNGERSFSASAQAGIYLVAVNCSGSGSFTIDAIPRATTPTISGTLSLGSTITISTASRGSTAFTHRLYYSWGSIRNVLIATDVATSINWTIPKTLAENILAVSSGELEIRCVTYNGSEVIGIKAITETVSVPDTEEFRPTIQSITAVDANDLPVNVYTVGKSQLKFTISAVGGYVSGSANRNSYPEKAVIVVDGVSYTVVLGQSAESTFTLTTNPLRNAGALYAMVTVTDSRGRTASMSFAYTAYEYEAPEISDFIARRCMSNGTLDDSGIYLSLYLRTSVSPLNSQNAKTYKIVYEKDSTETTIMTGELASYVDEEKTYYTYDLSPVVTFSVDSSWTIRAYVYDSFNSDNPAVATVIVPTEATFMDWRANGKGIAFGKVSTKDGLECAWPIYDRFDTIVNNGLASYGGGSNAIDPNTTIEHCILTNKNTPSTDFWYIETLFYSTKSATANRVQNAYPYKSGDSNYKRYYYNGAWSDWFEVQAVVERGASGIWSYKKMSSGEVELWGALPIRNVDCNIALGGMYRTAVITPDAFPFDVLDPYLVCNYESDGYGAIYWATNYVTSEKPPTFYLIRPTSATIVLGQILYRVRGWWY